RWILPQRAVIDRENAAFLLVHRAANCLIGATATTTGRDQITFFARALADSGACPRSRALPPTAAAGFCTETAKAAAGTIDTGGFSARQSDAAGIAAQRSGVDAAAATAGLADDQSTLAVFGGAGGARQIAACDLRYMDARAHIDRESVG